MEKNKNLNIVVVGKSGAGKSSLLNYLVNKEIFETGVGSPVTKTYFDHHQFNHPTKNVTYNLFDTKGIEPDTTDEFIDSVKGKIEEFADSDDVFDHIHTLYYCISAVSKRLEPFEVRFIKEMSEILDVVIVLTKADLVTEGDLKSFDLTLFNELSASEKNIDTTIRIIKVCSVAQTTRKGVSLQFGRDEILKHSFIGLWNTFSKEAPWSVYSMVLCGLSVEFSTYDIDSSFLRNAPEISNLERYNRTQSFQDLWYNYERYKDINFDGPSFSLLHLLRLPTLEELSFEKIDLGNKIILKIIFENAENLLKKFDEYDVLFTMYEDHLINRSNDILNFYSQLTGKVNEIPIPLIRSKKVLNEIYQHLVGDLKEYVELIVSVFIEDIKLLPLKDGLFNNLATQDREYLTESFNNYRDRFAAIDTELCDMLDNFREIFITELGQYGRLILGVNLNNDDELNYKNELKFALANDDLIDTSERRYLNRSKIQYNLSETRAEELENNAILENESFKKNED